MLLSARDMFDIAMEDSWMIGDKESDMLAGKKAGINNRILVSKNLKSEKATYCVDRVEDIVALID